MPITAADIRREVKEKNVTFIRLMFSDILGTMKTSKFLLQMNS
ncbi:glutamate-ammonia ligase [Streptococcus pneumoniae]|nr:glutamate-ammonia ligase [Streptococcus pneumoniae]